MAHVTAEIAHAAADQLPFFVYGTLMTGFRNHKSVVRGRHTSCRPAKLSGAVIFAYEAGFPGMYPASPEDDLNSFVCGQLLTFSPKVYASVMRDMDALEDYYGPGNPRNHYERRVVQVVADGDEGRTTAAYTYFSLLDRNDMPGCRVEGGDWRAYMRDSSRSDAADDWRARIPADHPAEQEL